MNKNVVIIGAGGHAKVIADVVRACNDNFLGFLDDDKEKDTIGTVADWQKYSDSEFVIGIGNPEVRKKLSETMSGAKWYTGIHPSAVISESAKLGEGTVVLPNAVVDTDAVVGKHCIINVAALVAHDNIVGDYCHVSAGVKLGGTVCVGDKSWIGIGATVRNNISICENTLVGAGAVVVKNIETPGTYVGVPAKKK